MMLEFLRKSRTVAKEGRSAEGVDDATEEAARQGKMENGS
jgi:hypothetical protein